MDNPEQHLSAQEDAPSNQEGFGNLYPTTPFPDDQISDEQKAYQKGYTEAREIITRITEDELRRDVDRKAKQNLELTEKAETDELTGLRKKQTFLRAADAHIAAEPKNPFGLLFIDLLHFKQVNDNHGHEMGDKALCAVANFLKYNLRRYNGQADIVTRGRREDDDDTARLGGDEFAVFANLSSRDGHSGTPEENLATLRERLQNEFDTSLTKEGLADLTYLGFGITIGGVIRQQGETAATMLERADQEMYREKKKQHELAPISRGVSSQT